VNVASSDADGLARAIQMISDITAVPEVGKTYLGKVVRLAEFGAFVEIFPGTDGLLHVSEIAEHRVKEVKDELREGDQILVKVLSIEGNRIKLSRKAVLREQREKLGLPPVADPGGSGGSDRGGRERDRDRGERGNRGRGDDRPAPVPAAVAEAPVDDDEEFDDEEFDGEDEGVDEDEATNEQSPATGAAPGSDAGAPRPAGQRRGRRRRGRRPGGGGNAGAPPAAV
jgi:polyribonucleotide nucleotidyltransferase